LKEEFTCEGKLGQRFVSRTVFEPATTTESSTVPYADCMVVATGRHLYTKRLSFKTRHWLRLQTFAQVSTQVFTFHLVYKSDCGSEIVKGLPDTMPFVKRVQ